MQNTQHNQSGWVSRPAEKYCCHRYEGGHQVWPGKYVQTPTCAATPPV